MSRWERRGPRLAPRPSVVGVGLVGLGGLVARAPVGTVGRAWWPWLVLAGIALVATTLLGRQRRWRARAGWAHATGRGPARLAIVGVGGLGLGVVMARMPAHTPGRGWWAWLLIAGVLLLTSAVVVGRNRWGGSAGLVGRWSRRSRRNAGVASAWAILRVASALAVKRNAAVLRPSLAALPAWRRWVLPARAVGTPLARVGLLRIWSPIEDVTLRIGGPRVGKTGELAGRILDAAGAVIATSTRTDLIDLTKLLRSRVGPVGVFNPSGLGGIPSTVTFDPLSGCEQPAVATTRAADLLAAVSGPGRDGGDREFWASQARRVLASLMHAAALGGASMRDVLAWVADPDEATALVQRLLRRSPEPAYESDALQFLTTNERTRSSICATVMPGLGWLTDTTAAAAATGGSFDVEALLAARGTVYMLGAEDTAVAPLVTALTGHIAREARRIAARQPAGRLDPPLTLALDEAALICPIPLDNWTADMGGRGVTIHIAAQSRAQLRQRWGEVGAAAILNNAATLLIYGGTRDPEDLAAYALLTGERDEHVPSFDPVGRVYTTTIRRVPVLSAAQIAQLPARHVVIVRRGLPPAIGRVRMAWARLDVRAAARSQRWAGRAQRLGRWWERLAGWVSRRVEGAGEGWLAPVAERLDARRDATGRGDPHPPATNPGDPADGRRQL